MQECHLQNAHGMHRHIIEFIRQVLSMVFSCFFPLLHSELSHPAVAVGNRGCLCPLGALAKVSVPLAGIEHFDDQLSASHHGQVLAKLQVRVD